MAQLICETVVYGQRGRHTDPDAVMHGPDLIPEDVGWDDYEEVLRGRRFEDHVEFDVDDPKPLEVELDWTSAVIAWRGGLSMDDLSFF